MKFFQNGCLKYIDRKDDLSYIKRPYGKLVAPNKIENIYIQSIYVGQCYVDVDFDRVREKCTSSQLTALSPEQSYLIGIIVPDIGKRSRGSTVFTIAAFNLRLDGSTFLETHCTKKLF